jgi:type I restriction enzyme S subunit
VSDRLQAWSSFNLRLIGSTVGGKTPSKSISEFWSPGEVHWASPKDMKSFILSDTQDKISHRAVRDAGMQLLPRGTVLVVTRSGILAHTLPIAIASIETTINQDIKAVLPQPNLHDRYLAYAIRANADEILRKCAKQGTTVPSVETALLEIFNLPLAPFNEQKRIADKLDAVLARVDACRERLDRVPAILKLFRQAVLAAATSGALTEEWRATVSGHDLADWKPVTLESLLDGKPRNGYSPRAVEYETPVKSLTLTATTTGRFRPEHFKYIDEDIPPSSHLWLQPGDILIQRANTIEYVGISAIYDGPPNGFIYPDLMMKCRANARVIPTFLHCLLLSEPVRRHFRENATGTAGNMPKINQQTVLSAPALVPPHDEQSEIVRRIEDLFSYADRLEARYTAARAKVERLTPALLAKAFRGELVPQDPNDEPASVLLERIRAARTTSEGAAGPKRRKGRGRLKTPQKAEVIMLTRKDIQDTPHLSTILKERGPLTAEALWSASHLDIDDFYDQLKDEEARGLLREKRGDSSDAPRMLEVA